MRFISIMGFFLIVFAFGVCGAVFLGLGLIAPIIVAFLVTIITVLLTKVDKGSNNIVVGSEYEDLGQGPIYLGPLLLFLRVKDYNPMPRELKTSITLPSRTGEFLKSSVTLHWRPDANDLRYWFEEKPDGVLQSKLTAHLQAWSKRLTAQDIYFTSPPELNIKGLVVYDLIVTDIADEGGMKRHIRDNTNLIESLVSEMEDEDAIEQKRVELKALYPDKADRIDRLCNNRQWAIQKRGLSENR